MKRNAPLATIAVASALFLAGCAGGGQSTDPSVSESASPPAATSSGSAGAVSDEHSEQDTMFAQRMIPHHEHAVEMSEMLLAKDDVPAEVTEFA